MRILSIDAKDLYTSNHLLSQNATGYIIRTPSGEINTKKFINTLDHSLELAKLREVYEKVYRRINFTFNVDGFEYTTRVINVTFKYTDKEFNKYYGGTYVRTGYHPNEVELSDGVCVRDGELIAIQCDVPIKRPIDDSLLPKWFRCVGEHYECCGDIPVLHNRAELREELYQNGFVCDGVKYVRYKRSSGSSRVGKCLFIDEALYPRMHKWELCGLKIKDGDQVDLAAYEAYASLTLSSIIDTVEINPENILLIDDYVSEFTDKCVAVTFEDGLMRAETRDVQVHNSIWDGQSLLDSSICAKYGNHGMMLLRNRFFKSCCFNTNIQQFFSDYGITSIDQLNGYTVATRIEDIKLITTPSSVKYLKFGTMKQWLDNLDVMFGLVKHEHRTHFFQGRMVQCHYQLLNSLQLSQQETDEFMRPSLEYLTMIKEDPSVFRYFIRYPVYSDDGAPVVGLNTKNDIVYKMLGVNDRFAETKLYYAFREDTTKSYVRNLRHGHVLVNGNYSVLCGNPMEMLLSSVGAFDGVSTLGIGNVHTHRFKYNTKILGSRSPHVCSGNVWVASNIASMGIDHYFNFTDEILCMNSIGENVLARLSDSDFDADTAMLTDNPVLLNAAIRNYDKFPVPTKLIDSTKVVRHYTAQDLAQLDIATSVNKIGEIVNLSQEINTKMWDRLNNGASWEEIMPLYNDVALLDVLSNISIDSAKREYPVNCVAELRRLKAKYHSVDKHGKKIMPGFFAPVSRSKGYYDSNSKTYLSHDTTMDYVQKSINACRKAWTQQKFIPFVDVLDSHYCNAAKANYDQIYRVIDIVANAQREIKALWSPDTDCDATFKHEMSNEIRQKCTEHVGKIRLSGPTMYMLLAMLDEEKYSGISRMLFNVLFGAPNMSFFEVIDGSRQPRDVLVEDSRGDIKIHDFSFTKHKIPQNIGSF